MTIFSGKGYLVAKININFFITNEILSIFYLTIFSKKKNFQNNCEKSFLEGMTIFQGTGCWTTKMNITFSAGNGVPNLALKFFLKKPHTDRMKAKKPFLEVHFHSYQWFYWTDYFQKKNRIHPCVDSHRLCEFHENRLKTATCIVTVIIVIS